ncbi:MAG: cyclic nucleotide-binding domain-containing protein [Anaerolineaceae bacterium]|jgi:CRP-like cAMP-binding protein
MTNVKQTVAFLEKVPLFKGLNRRQLEHLSKRFVEREYPAGRVIVEQNQGGEGFFIIVSGAADVIRERSDGTKVTVNQFVATDFFGELALLDDGLRTASVIATQPTMCLVLTRWDFLGTLKEDCEMAIPILQELARRFRIALETV